MSKYIEIFETRSTLIYQLNFINNYKRCIHLIMFFDKLSTFFNILFYAIIDVMVS